MARNLFLLFLDVMFWRSISALFTTSDCGTTKSCIQLSSSCDPSSADCLFFSWKWTGTDFEMELSGGAGSGSTYSAVAFGQVDDMQDADMYYCTGDGLVSGVIRASRTPPTDLSTNSGVGLSDITSKTEDGVAQCTFKRSASVTKEISGGANKNFDLSSETYYILLAKGPISGGTMGYHGPSNRLITGIQIDMTGASLTTSTPSTDTTTTAVPGSACGNTKGCFQSPAGCTEGSPDCTYFTWAYDGTNFEMELSGGEGNGETYSAVAFGQVDDMQDADMYYCTGSSFVSGVIRTRRQPPTDLDASTELGLFNVSSITENGVAKCTFKRSGSVTKTISNAVDKNFNLTSGEYYILLAKGSISGGAMQYHMSNRRISDRKIDMTETRSTSQSTDSITDMTEAPSTSQITDTTSGISEVPSSTQTPTSPPDSECGKSKGCFQHPDGCMEGSPDCVYFTWAYVPSSNTWNMELSGGAGGGETYAGVAFGQYNAMRDADLYVCTGTNVRSGAITNLHEAPQISQGESGLSNTVAMTSNGAAKCSFTRAASVVKTDSDGTHNYDLSSAEYYLLLARGTMSGSSLVQHASTDRSISSKKIDFKTNSSSRVHALPNAHRIFFACALLLAKFF